METDGDQLPSKEIEQWIALTQQQQQIINNLHDEISYLHEKVAAQSLMLEDAFKRISELEQSLHGDMKLW